MKLKSLFKNFKFGHFKLISNFKFSCGAGSRLAGQISNLTVIHRFRRSRRFQIGLIAIILFAPMAIFLLRNPAKAAAAWFDDNFAYRQSVTVTNSGSSQTDYQIPISLDTATLITAGKMRSDCYDLRVTDYGGNLLPLWIETGTNACNTATTQIWVKVPSVPTPNNILLIYYGNPTVTTGTNGHDPSSADAGKEVFESFDSFDTLDTSKWTVTGSPTVSGGEVTLTNGQTLVTTGTVTSSSGLARVIARVKQAATNQTAGKIGLYNSNDAASIGFGNLEEKLTQIVPSNIISHHKLEETTTTDANQFKASGYLDTGKLSQAVSVYGNAAGTTGSTLTFNRGAQISGNNYEHLNTNQGTFSFWVKPSWASTDTQDRYFYTNNWIKIFKSSQNLKFIYGNAGQNIVYNIGNGGANWQTTSWYHVVARWDVDNVVNGSNYAELYVNGALVGQNTNAVTADTVAVRQFIGSDNSGQNQAASLIDDFAIFDRVLTTTEISNIYNSGTGREAGYVADPSLKFYAKMDGSGTLSPVTYNGGANVDQTAYNSSTNTNGNMITNGNMEAASGGLTTSWSLNKGTETAADAESSNILFDTRSQKITTAGSDSSEGIKTVDITVTANTTYTVSGWVKSNGSTAVRLVPYDVTNSSNMYIYSITSSSSWTGFDSVLKTASNQTTLRLYFLTNALSAHTYYLDNVSLTPNLVDNGGMEGTYSSGVAPGWTLYGSPTTVAAETTVVHSGSESQKIITSGSSQGVKQTISTTSGNWYLVSGWLYSFGSNAISIETSLGVIGTSSASSWVRVSKIIQATSSSFILYELTAGTASGYFDDVSVIPLDNTALSFQAWAPANDTASANPLSIHGGTSGVASNTSGKLNNGYTFDGSTGYLRQKTYLTNIGTLSYGTNQLTDTGQTFTSYKANPATYMIVVTNSDNTTTWGYIGTTSGATIVDVFTTKALSVAGWNGTSPSGKTPVGYEVRKTDYQLTGTSNFTVGAWIKPTSTSSTYVIAQKGNTGERFLLQTNGQNIEFKSTMSGWKTAASTTNPISSGNWYFALGTYDGSYLYVYLNGTLLGTSALATGGYDGSSDSIPFAVGARIYASVDQFFPGSIDSPFVLNTALTADQVAALYQYHSLATTNNGSINVVNGSGTPTNDTNYHTYLLTAGSASTTAASDNTTFATSSTNLPNEAVNLRLMNSDATNALTVDWVAVAKQASTAPTVAAPASEEKGGAPVAYWKFDDGTGTNAQDSSPNNNDGTITGATWQTEDQCVAGKCLKFNGTSDFVNINNSTTFDGTSSTITVSGWVKHIPSNDGIMVAKGGGSSGGWNINTSSDGKVYVAFKNGSGNSVIARNSSSTLNSNQWNFITVNMTVDTTTLGNNNIQIYVNGSLNQGSLTQTSLPTVSTAKLKIGARGADGSEGTFYQGFIDDVKIYNYARTAAQVKLDFNSRGASKGLALRTQGQALPDALSNGLVGYWKMDESSWTNDCSTASVLDSSGNGNNGKSCPNATGISTPAAGKFGLSGSFDGVDDYVQTANTFNFGSYSQQSFSLWFKVNTLPTGSNLATLYAHTDSNLSTGFDQNLHVTPGAKVRLTAYSAAIQATTLTTTSSITTGTWYHVTFTSDGKTAQLYLNGNLEATGSLVGFYSIARPITFGRYDTGYVPFTGSLDEARLYNRALSPREVRDLYNWAPGPVGYWNFEEKSGASAYDISGNSQTGTINGNPTWTSSKVTGSALNFDGAGDYVSYTLPSTSPLKISGALTLGFWMNTTTGSSDAGLVGTGIYTGYQCTHHNGATLYCYISDGANGITAALGTGAWKYISFTWDGTTGTNGMKLYIDGVLTSQRTSTVAAASGWTTLQIGKASTDYNGKLDDVKIYNYVRTQKQIVEDMNAGHPSVGSPVGSAVGYWKFDEGYGTTANNSGSQGTALNGTITGATWNNNGKFNKALQYTNGVATKVTVSDNSAIDLGTGSMTLSAWFKTSATGVTQTIIRKDNGAGLSGYIFRIETDNRLRITFNDASGAGGTNYFTGVTVTDGAWHHAVMSYNRDLNVINGYVDGILKISPSNTLTGTIDNSNAMTIGGTNSASESFTGLIDEVKIYNYALTSDEVALDYNKGAAIVMGNPGNASSSASTAYCIPGDASTCTAPVGEWNFEEGSGQSANDTSGNGNTGTLGFNSSVASDDPSWTTGKYGKGLSFDGSNDYINVSDISSVLTINTATPPTFTLGAWFKPTSGGSDLSGISLSSSIQSARLFYRPATTQFCMQMKSATGSVICTGASSIIEGNWYHVEAIYESATSYIYIYLNGVLKSSGAATDANLSTGNNIPYIGYAQNFFKGSIDGVRIYNYARTAAQVAWDYNKGAPVAQYKMDECQGATIHNSQVSSTNLDGTITIGASGTQTAVGTCTTSGAWFNGATGKYNSSLNFDGTDDVVTIANTISNVGSVGFWVYPTSNTASMLQLTATGTITASSGTISAGAGFTSPTIYVNGKVASTLTANTWNHIAVTTATGISANAIKFGLVGSTYFAGQIDDVQIFNYALTATQVKNLFNQGSAVRFGPGTGSP